MVFLLMLKGEWINTDKNPRIRGFLIFPSLFDRGASQPFKRTARNDRWASDHALDYTGIFI